ncbi:MAG: hypothetical protein KGH63_02385, partial [Candidatus Micrarchaeota archaeon]|nr:hypothetical protein [Candidatus Micrarchaeota archaeon]
RTRDDPFSLAERRRLIGTMARAKPKWKGRVRVHALPDFPGDDEKWTRALGRKFSPLAFSVGSANAWVRRCAKKAGFEIDPAPLFRRHEWVGTQIRARVRAGKKWAHLVPLPLREWMEKKGARIITASQS